MYVNIFYGIPGGVMECHSAGLKNRLISVEADERFFLCVNCVGFLEVLPDGGCGRTVLAEPMIVWRGESTLP